MKILGINSGIDGRFIDIDSCGSALIVDGDIKMAIAEERVSRRKHDGGYKQSLHKIMDSCGYSIKDIDKIYISFYGVPLTPSKEIIKYHLKLLGIEHEPEKLVVVPSHHLSHAAAGFFLSPFESAIILVADSEGTEILFDTCDIAATGNYERNSYYLASHNSIHLLERDFDKKGEIGFGKAWTRFTRYIGFNDYHSAGKTMGLAAYGELSDELINLDLFEIDKHNRLTSKLTTTLNNGEGLKLFFEENNISIPPFGTKNSFQEKEYQNLASYIQYQMNKFTEIKLSSLLERTGIQNVILSGGFALNTTMNSYLEETLGVKIFVPPYPCDEGQALGNAMLGYIKETKADSNSILSIKRFSNYTYLGPEYDEDEILKVLNSELTKNWEISLLSNIEESVAKLLVEGKYVGWYQGRSEYGARALGNRSIISSPQFPSTQKILNEKKGREAYRPFAPSVLEEYASQYFQMLDSELYLHMLGVVRVKEEMRHKMPGVIHIDGTARIQLVNEKSNKKFFNLIKAFHNLSGIPIVLNTSFNYAGEPIVENPTDAVVSGEKIQLDAIAIENYLLKRK